MRGAPGFEGSSAGPLAPTRCGSCLQGALGAGGFRGGALPAGRAGTGRGGGAAAQGA